MPWIHIMIPNLFSFFFLSLSNSPISFINIYNNTYVYICCGFYCLALWIFIFITNEILIIFIRNLYFIIIIWFNRFNQLNGDPMKTLVWTTLSFFLIIFLVALVFNFFSFLVFLVDTSFVKFLTWGFISNRFLSSIHFAAIFVSKQLCFRFDDIYIFLYFRAYFNFGPFGFIQL